MLFITAFCRVADLIDMSRDYFVKIEVDIFIVRIILTPCLSSLPAPGSSPFS